MHGIKVLMAKNYIDNLSEEARKGMNEKAEQGIWQRRFWEHLIRDEKDFDAHIAYVHWNPVKHGHVADPDDWPFSSWHGWKREFGQPVGIPAEDWKPVHLGER